MDRIKVELLEVLSPRGKVYNTLWTNIVKILVKMRIGEDFRNDNVNQILIEHNPV